MNCVIMSTSLKGLYLWLLRNMAYVWFMSTSLKGYLYVREELCEYLRAPTLNIFLMFSGCCVMLVFQISNSNKYHDQVCDHC